jgi:hypothetical protein
MLAALTLALGAALAQQSDVQVHVSLSDDRIAVGASTMLQITVEASGGRPDEIELPPLPASLDVLSSREYLQTQLSLPGGRTTIVRRDVVLRARAEGLFYLPPAVVRLSDGTVLQSRPLTLRVVATAPGARRAPGGLVPGALSPSTDAGELRVTITPDTAWLGEPVLLRMTAVIPEGQRTRRGRAPTFEPPTAPGFWVQEVEDRGAVGVRTFGAEYYDVHEYRRLYIPLTPGEHELSPGRAVYDVDRGWMFAPQSYELVGDTVSLPVRALPTAGRPPSFTGAVGHFDVSATLDRTSLAVGDAATLTVDIEGSGNIKALPAPALPEIAGVDVLAPTEDATFTARTSGIHGRKRFRWILVPEDPGTVELPAIQYAWFDPATARYDSASVSLPALTVRGTIVVATPDDTALAPLRTAPEPVPAASWAASRSFAMLQLLPLVLMAGALGWRRQAPRMRAARALRRGREERFARARERAQNDPRSALGELQHAVDEAIAAMAGTRSVEPDALRAGGLDEDTVGSIAILRAAIHTARFRPEPLGLADVDVLLQRAELLLRRIERARRGRHAAAVALLPLLLMTSAASATSQAAIFADAVAAAERGAWADARTGFTAYLREHPLDAAAWYDLGITDFRRGATGPAVHAWARALQIQPRADDARHNLRAVGADDAVLAARRPVPFTANELRAVAGLAWLFGGALLALRVAAAGRAGRLAGSVGAAAVLVAGVAMLGVAAHRTWPDAAIVVRASVLRTGPVLRSETRATLREGALARVIASDDEWVRVRVEGAEGWVEARDLGRIH